MGSYDAAEVCELVGIFMLNLIYEATCDMTIKAKDRETIFYARKLILYNEGEPLKNKKIIKNKPITSTL